MQISRIYDSASDLLHVLCTCRSTVTRVSCKRQQK